MAGSFKFTVVSLLTRPLIWLAMRLAAPGSLGDALGAHHAGNHAESLRLVDIALQNPKLTGNPKHAGMAYSLRGDCLLSLDRFPEARAAYFAALDLDPSAGCCWNLGLLAVDQSDSDAARRALAAIATQFSDDSMRAAMAQKANLDLEALRHIADTSSPVT